MAKTGSDRLLKPRNPTLGDSVNSIVQSAVAEEFTRAELAVALSVSDELIGLRARRERWKATRHPARPTGVVLVYRLADLPEEVRRCLETGSPLPSRRLQRVSIAPATTRVATMLRQAIADAGLTQKEFTTAMGQAHNALHGILFGQKRCTAAMALRLAKVHGLDSRELATAQALDDLDAARSEMADELARLKRHPTTGSRAE